MFEWEVNIFSSFAIILITISDEKNLYLTFLSHNYVRNKPIKLIWFLLLRSRLNTPSFREKVTNFIWNFKIISDYLLSNNHVNSIIVHKFDFSDEEVMAYYISFLKTLSFRLNKHTIHFFYNEVRHRRFTLLNDFFIKSFEHFHSRHLKIASKLNR